MPSLPSGLARPGTNRENVLLRLGARLGTCVCVGLAVSLARCPSACLAQLRVASGLQPLTLLPWMSEPRSRTYPRVPFG